MSARVEASPSYPVARATAEPRPSHPRVATMRRFARNRPGLIGLIILVVLIVVAVLAPVISPFNPIEQHPGSELARPGSPFVLGTDQLGRDLLSRIIYGSRNSFLVGVVAVALGAGIGIATGLLAGFAGGWLDAVIMRIYDALLAFPAILLGVAVVTVLGPGTLSVAYAIALASLPDFARLTRSRVLAERELEYVQAARCIGAGDSRIMWRHVLPNTMAPLLVQLSLSMSFAVLAESGLSFLGLGTQPPDPSWGAMLSDSRAYLRQAPWYGVFPGLALALLLLGLNFVSDALRDALDPRRINA